MLLGLAAPALAIDGNGSDANPFVVGSTGSAYVTNVYSMADGNKYALGSTGAGLSKSYVTGGETGVGRNQTRSFTATGLFVGDRESVTLKADLPATITGAGKLTYNVANGNKTVTGVPQQDGTGVAKSTLTVTSDLTAPVKGSFGSVSGMVHPVDTVTLGGSGYVVVGGETLTDAKDVTINGTALVKGVFNTITINPGASVTFIDTTVINSDITLKLGASITVNEGVILCVSGSVMQPAAKHTISSWSHENGPFELPAGSYKLVSGSWELLGDTKVENTKCSDPLITSETLVADINDKTLTVSDGTVKAEGGTVVGMGGKVDLITVGAGVRAYGDFGTIDMPEINGSKYSLTVPKDETISANYTYTESGTEKTVVNRVTVKQDTVFPAWNGVLPTGADYKYENVSGRWVGAENQSQDEIAVTYSGNSDELTISQDNAAVNGTFKKLDTGDHTVKVTGDLVVDTGSFNLEGTPGASLTVNGGEGKITGEFKSITVKNGKYDIDATADSLTAETSEITVKGKYKEITVTESKYTIEADADKLTVSNTVTGDESTIKGSFGKIEVNGGKFHIESTGNATLTVNDGDGIVTGKFYKIIVNGGKVADESGDGNHVVIDHTTSDVKESAIEVKGGTLTLSNNPSISVNSDNTTAVHVTGGSMTMENGSVTARGAGTKAISVSNGGEFILGDPVLDEIPSVMTSGGAGMGIYVNNEGTATIYRGDIQFFDPASYGVYVADGGHLKIYSNDEYGIANAEWNTDPDVRIHGGKNGAAAINILYNGTFEIRGRGALIEEPNSDTRSYALYISSDANTDSSVLAGGTYNGKIFWDSDESENLAGYLIENNHYVRYDGSEADFGWSDGTRGFRLGVSGDSNVLGGVNYYDDQFSDTIGERGEHFSIIDAEWELRYAMANGKDYQIPSGIIQTDEAGYGPFKWINGVIELDKNDPAKWGIDKRQGDVDVTGVSTLYLAGRKINNNGNYDYTDTNKIFRTERDDNLHTIAVTGANAELKIVSAILDGEGIDTKLDDAEGGYVSSGAVTYQGFFSRRGGEKSSAIYVKSGKLTVVSGITTGGESGIYTVGGETVIGTAPENVSNEIILSYADKQAVRVAGGKVTLNGGANLSYNDGILVEDGTLDIKGGLIIGHNANTGSGIRTTGGETTITGGAIYGHYYEGTNGASAKDDENGRSLVIEGGTVTVAIDEAHKNYVSDFTRETAKLHHLNNIVVKSGTLNYGITGETDAYSRNNGALTVEGGTVNYYDGVTVGKTTVYGVEHTAVVDFNTKFCVEDGDFGDIEVTGYNDENTVAYNANSFHNSVQLHGGYYNSIETRVRLTTGETTLEDILGTWKIDAYDGTNTEAKQFNHYIETVTSARNARGEWNRVSSIQSGEAAVGTAKVEAAARKAVSVRNAINEFKAWAAGSGNATYKLYTNLWIGDKLCAVNSCDANAEAPVDIKRSGAALELGGFGIYGNKSDSSILDISGSAAIKGADKSIIKNLSGNAVAVNGKLTLDEGAAISGKTAVTNNGTLTVNNAVLSGKTGNGLDNSGTATVNEGAVISGTKGIVNNSGALTVKDGEITGNESGIEKLDGTVTLNGGTVSSVKNNVEGETVEDLLGKGLTLKDANGIIAGADVLGRQEVKGGDNSGEVATGGESIKYDGDALKAVAYTETLAANFTVTEKTFSEISLKANDKATLTVESAVKAALDAANVKGGEATLYIDKNGSADVVITPESGCSTGSVKLNGKAAADLSNRKSATAKVTAKDSSLEVEAKPFEVIINKETGVTVVKDENAYTYTVTGDNLQKPTVQKMSDEGKWETFETATVEKTDNGYTVTFGNITPLESDYRINAYKVHMGGAPAPKTYEIVAEEPENGKLEASAESESAGNEVALTVTPSDGYIVTSVTVEDEEGKKVEVKTEDGKYVFTMPASNVTAKASFTKKVSRIFDDVIESDWFDPAVQYCYDNGLIKGTSENLFSPSLDTTRGMIVTILYRVEKEPGVTTLASFTDVESGNWYAESVTWAQEKGIVNGYPDGSFGAEDYITREQLAAILYKYAAYKGFDITAKADISAFDDASEISDWALTAVEWANANGFINGYDNKLNPKGYATRAEAAAIIYRFCTSETVK